ncbi:RHS repeat-associated core domain-containing protein [Kaistella sp.]|uniref:RHS repeat-associated core domain-containing protein n=1 Tax=Kaistella sp. TaxID=2782235 RepID=UPI003C48A3E4
MKQKILFLYFFASNLLFFSQEIATIPLNYNTSGYAKNDSIQNNQIAIPNTEDRILTPTVNAEMTVSESGALTYSLPIEMLKGINNFNPNIALVYNSQSGNGQAGWGWNIIGLSTITRGGKSKEVDGITIGPQYDETDPFYLDGQRLIKISPTSFVTKTFSKIKVTKPVTGDYSFIVQYTDGRIAKYKEIVSGQSYISTFIDAFDNEIHYTYESENNIPRIVKISYGGTNIRNDKFYVNFIYKTREKNLQIYRNGIPYINTKVLSQIVSGSTYTQIYRTYSFQHDFIEDYSIERLITINVENENGEYLKPLHFNYNNSNKGIVTIKSRLQIKTGISTGLGTVTLGDFVNGDDKIQPIFQIRKSYTDYGVKLGNSMTNSNLTILRNDSETLFFSGKVLDLNNKITEKDQLIIVNENYVGETDEINPNNPINSLLKDEVVFEIKNVITNESRNVTVAVKGGLLQTETYESDDPYDYNSHGNYVTSYIRDPSNRKFVQADFNNDGLIDFLIIEPENLKRTNNIYFVELGKLNSGNDVKLTGLSLNDNFNLYDKEIYPIEFDGDGLPELLAIDRDNKNFSVYKINFNNYSLETVLHNQPLANFNKNTPIFLGDFNGDGLTDFLTPQKVYEIPENDNSGLDMGDTYYKMQTETLLWWKYTNNGISFSKIQEDYTEQKIAYLKPSQRNFIKKSTFWQKFWDGKPDSYEYTRYSTHNIIITDFNNDGRSDIITLNKIGTVKYNNANLGNTVINNVGNTLMRYDGSHYNTTSFQSSIVNKITFYENKNLQDGTFKMLNSGSLENKIISPLSLIVSSTEFDYLNVSKSGAYIYDSLVGESTVIAVDNTDFLEKQIQEVDNGSGVLQKVDYRNMIASPSSDEATYLYKSQDFQYPYFVHKSNSILYFVSKIHTVFNNKILTKEYRYENGIQNLEGKGFIGFQKTYSSDAYESELKNKKYINLNPAKAVFWNVQTKDPLMENATVISTYGGLTKFFTENKITNRKFNIGNNQYLILPTDEVSKDYLKKITINKSYIYDENDDLKLKTSYVDYGGVGSSISEYTYQNEFSYGTHYFYGKIATNDNTIYKEGLSFTTKEEYDYDNSNGALSENRSYGNQANAPPVIKNYTYDSATGNLLSQKISAQGVSPQTTTYDYDSTKRYINKTTTPDGLIAISNVNVLGRVLDETAPIGNLKTFYQYDSWGNIITITDFLGKKTTISKNRTNLPTNGIYNLSKKREGGTESVVTFDIFDREIQSKTQSINGKWLVSKTEYDIFGKTTRTSEIFFEGETPKWNSVEYDELNRPVKNIAFTGKVITTCYEGMKVTVDDGYKKTSKTLDVMGNTIRHQDQGGVINYSYFPNGALKESNYEGIKTTFEIDGWGNKTKIIDPSAGTFSYEYDNLSRVTKETTPKGTTVYTYDYLGRPLTETTTGNTTAENTNISKTYTYNNATKLPETITGTSNNGKTFTYTTIYDAYYRIKGKKEETPYFTYESSTTFDSFGRADVVTISTKLLTPSYISTSSIQNVYDGNGILLQQNDINTGKMVWHVSDINAQGQTTQMEYGNGYSIINQYSPIDFSLFNIKHQNTINGTVALDIDYNYDVNKGVLNWRRNNTFGKKEDFTYDTLNRLLTETVNGVLANEYTYDQRGRITSNSELGKYNYNHSDYKLQNITFNTNGQNVNNQRGFAAVTYNAFKSPLQITLAGKEDLSFEYSILKTRSAMTSSVTGKTRYYSSDFAVEITQTGNQTEIITYITGDPYSANYIKKEVLTGTVLAEKENYFLHRNNLGSILAITKATDGTVVEKRFFDAWGNLKGFVNAAGTLITDAQQLSTVNFFLYRGYTGHEHLWKAGLINMNARIYDPILRKFLSPDNYVQDPFNTQSYDRFSYVFNNPLLFTDPSGNFGIIAAVLVGAAVGLFAKGIANMMSGIPFWYGLGKATLMGAISGAISLGIGNVATSAFGEAISIGKALFEAGLHAFSSGTIASLDNGNSGAAMLSGLVSSLIASGVSALGTSFSASKALGKTVQNGFGQNYMKATMIVAGGFSGGISSVIAGGKFMDGFRQGLITSGLNHVAHMGAAAIEEGKANRQIKTALTTDCGDDYLNQPITEATLQDLASVFADLYGVSSKEYAFANKDNIYDKLEIDNGQLYDDGQSVNGVTHMFNGKVLFSPHFLGTKDILKFAGTWYHETIHSIHAVNGFFINTLKQFMKNGYGYDDAVRSATNVSETIAHLQTRNYGIGLSFGTSYSTIRKYGASYIEFLSFK